jgi:hypothetical protein
MIYDIVIVHGVKDSDTLPYCVEYIKKNVEDKRNIYIISQDPNHHIFLNSVFNKNNSDIIIVPETQNYPFTIKDIDNIIQTPSRNGWYYQQLLKLYASFAIPDMLDNYVVVDSDTIFLKPISFQLHDRYVFNIATENHIPYFEHMKLLNPELQRVNKDISGITHHMIFNRNIIIDLFKFCSCDKDTFWKKFLECVDPSQRPHSGASEYEIYFNYMLKYCKSSIILRKVRFENIGEFPETAIPKYINSKDIGYISLHSWMRQQPKSQIQQSQENPLLKFHFGLKNLNKDIILSGENLQSLCDVTITTREIDNFHKSLSPNTRKIFIDNIIQDNTKKSYNFNSFFVYTHILEKFIKDIVPHISNPFIVMTHNSDHPVNETHLSLLENNKLIHMFSQNTFIYHPKLTALPIGIANNQWPHGNKDIVANATRICTPIPFITRLDGIYVNFSIGTYREHRQNVYDILKKKDFTFFDVQKPFNQLWETMYQFKWIACPRGNGVDTHRLWETLYAGCIPLVDTSINSKSFNKLPIIYINDWNSITLEFLQNETRTIIQKFFNNEYDFNLLHLHKWKELIEDQVLVIEDQVLVNHNNLSLSDLQLQESGSRLTTSCSKEGAFILAYIGTLPNFTEDCIHQIRLWNPSEEIYLCITLNQQNSTEGSCNDIFCKKLVEKYNIKIVNIHELNKTQEHIEFDKSYTNMSMNGFWKYTTERFFIVEECMRKFNLQNIIHIELDNLIYFNMSEMLSSFKSLNSIAIPSDCEKRFIAGICFVNTSDELRKLNRFFSLNSYNRAEMEVILHYNKYNNNCIKILPTLAPEYILPLVPDQGQPTYDKRKFSNYVDSLKGIFDAAALGQYLFGIDPIHKATNTDGFINESTCFKINKQHLEWRKLNNLYRLYISADQKNWYPMYNLHVHNKNLKRGLSDKLEMEKHLPNIL